ncbi:MAG: guanylate kinase [Pseudomonadota bacterium]
MSNRQQQQLLFVVSAPSGAGKTSLCSEVLRQVSALRFSISHTTRAPRAGEEHGKNYFFVSQEQFREYLAHNKIAEWTEIYGNCYGTAKETIHAAGEQGFDLLFDIDERGGRQLSEAYAAVVTILVLPPSMEVLRKRLIDRGTETQDSLRTRLQRAKEEIERMRWYTHVIVNDAFAKAAEQLKSIIIAERTRHDHGSIEVLLNE